MKFFSHLILLGSTVGLMLTASPSFATVVGNLSIGGDATLTVTPNSVVFSENGSFPGSSQVGANTNLSYSGGSVSVGQPVVINNGNPISLSSTPASVPVTFPDETGLSFNLTTFGPGSSNTNCADLSTGQSCSPTNSPVILTYTGTGIEGTPTGSLGTSAALTVAGTAMDPNGTISNVTGLFTASIPGETPEQLVTTDTSVSATYSGGFTVSAGTTMTPEPNVVWVMALAGLLMGLVAMKRRQKQTQA
jgi:hypothetical protein